VYALIHFHVQRESRIAREIYTNVFYFTNPRWQSLASQAGVCRGSETPTIYVGDIDMYIPLEEPNA